MDCISNHFLGRFLGLKDKAESESDEEVEESRGWELRWRFCPTFFVCFVFSFLEFLGLSVESSDDVSFPLLQVDPWFVSLFSAVELVETYAGFLCFGGRLVSLSDPDESGEEPLLLLLLRFSTGSGVFVESPPSRGLDEVLTPLLLVLQK